MFSRDWSNFRPLIERVLNNPESSKYFAYQSFNLGQLLIALGYQDQMITISKTLLQSDPSNGSLQNDLATALISKGKYEEFISEKGQSLSLEFRERTLIFLQIYSLLQLNRTSEAEELLSKFSPDNVRAYWDLRALIAFQQGHKEEALSLLNKRSAHRSSGWMVATDAILGREAANREAAHNDRRIVLDFSLFLALALTPDKLPYDLSATPNFAQRLKEAGSKK
jgi:tetratricopeptide (TPR) repeat protein